MERHMRLSRAAVVLVAIALIAAIAAAVWFASPDAPYVPSEDSGAALGTAAPAEDGTVASGYQPIGDGISSMDPTREKPKGDFYLTQDITITSLHSDDKWNQAFSGTFDGNGHTITINASHTTTCNDAGGMFIGLANGAVIKNLTIVVRGFSLGFSGDTINAGMIAGYAAGEKITIDNVKLVLERTSDGNDPVDDPVNYPVNDPYVYKSNEGIDTAINFGGLIGKVEDGTVTISNTTVINNETGTYGFSARNWVRAGYEGGWLGAGAYDSKSWTNVGGFVGSVQAGKEGNGNLTMNYVKYDAADGAKMSAYASSYGLTRQYNYARLSPFLGVLNVGALKVDNLIFNAGGTFTQMFYRDGSTTNEHNEGMYNGRGILIGYDVNKWLQTTGEGNGVSSRKNVYLRNAITGETGLGNGDKHTSLLAGNNSWLDGFMSYPSEIEDASFTDDGKIAFALPNRSGDIAKAVRQINQNGNVTTVSDAQIAEQVTEGGGLTWIEAPVVAHGDDTSVAASLNKVSTGTYNVQNYDAVSSEGDSAYLGSKVYDKNAVKTPTLNVGGTTVNAWTADNTTADAGTKTFSYNESALSGYVAATYNGGTYLVKGGTIYSPDTIIVNGEERPFALGKDFVYEITKAPVEVVVANIPGTFYAGDPMPELTVQSVTPNVPGQIKWKDSSLVYGKNEYGWTWTPEDDNNYQPDTGTVMLEVSQATIDEIVVSGDFETQYTAYDAFDPTGMVVTAYYDSDPEHERGVVLESGDYTVSVKNGVNDRLLVANDTVTVSLKEDAKVNTTFKIKVSKLVVDVPNEIQGRVYNGEVQTGVENTEHYTLTGNTAQNAGDYVATATLTYSENTRWNTADPDDTTPKEIGWTIAPMTLDGTVLAPTDLTYDGNAKEATFNRTSGELFNGDAVTIEYSGNNVNVTEAGFTATAQLPNDNYKWATDAPSANFMITPKTVNVTATSGSKEFAWIMASASELYELFELDGEKVNAEDKLIWKVNGEVVDMSDGNVSEIFDAKEYKIEIASADANYTLTGQTSTTFTITVKKVEKPIISDVREFTFNGTEQGFTIVENEEYEVKGDAKAANAGDYSFSIALKAPGNVVWSDGTTETITVSWKINKATFKSVTIEFEEGALDNLFTSSAMPTPTTITANPTPLPAGVEGKFEWLESSLSEDTHIYNWTYTVPNYNVFEGTQELTAQAAVLESITLSGEYKTEYTAYDFFDIDNLVVTAYFDNGNGEESRVLSLDEYTLQSQSNIAQEGVPQLVVGDTYVTVTYQDKSVKIPVTVTAKVIELPEVIEELTYTGEPQTPFDWRGAGYESYNAFFEELSSYSYCDPSIVLRTDAGDFTFTLTINDGLGNNVVFENGQKTFEVASKILPKRVYLGHGNYTWGWFYGDNPVVADLGGNTGDDVAFVRAYDEDGNLIKDSLAFVAEEKTGLEQLVDAKEYTLVFTLADSVKNYQADAYEVVVSVARKPVQATLTAPDSVVYTGKEINAILDVKTTLVGEDKVTVEYNDDADCINYTGEEIVATAQLPNDNYEWADGTAPTVSFTIQKATITSVTVTISEAPGGVWTTAMMPELTVVSVDPHVDGEVVWDNDSLIAGENKEQPWTFVPDSPNYEPYHGSVTLTVVQATLAGVSVEVVKTTEYVAFDGFDRSSIVVKALYGEGPKEITGYTLAFSGGSTEGRLLAGTGITVTVTYTDGDVTQYTEFTINVAKRTVAKPVVDPTIFDATGGTITLPIAESEYYTIYGNTAIEPGRYVATVELKDPANTMWEDGSTDDVSIAWTISEPVTSDEVIADILAMEKVTWQNAEEFLDLEARYNALDESEQTAEVTAKIAVLRAQYDALRNAAFDDIEAAHEVTAKSLGKALAAAAAGLSAAAIALAIAKRRSI